MTYAINLIDKAANLCGSHYKLAKRLDINLANLMKMQRGERPLPAEHVVELAAICGLDAATAVREVRAEKEKKLRGSKVGNAFLALGVAGMLLLSDNSSAHDRQSAGQPTSSRFDFVHIVSRWLHGAVRRLLESVYQGAISAQAGGKLLPQS